MRGTRQYLVPRDQDTILYEIAERLLAEEGASVPDWDRVREEIAVELKEQAGDLLVDAQSDYEAFETLRARAAQQYGRLDPIVSVLAGAVVVYLVLIFAGPLFLPAARGVSGPGLTPWFVIVPTLALVTWWPFSRRRRRALRRSVLDAYQRWTDVLRDQVLRPFITEKRNDEARNPRLYDAAVGQNFPPRFIEAPEPLRLIETETMARLRDTARNVHSGSLGLSGPRGVGKTTILRFFGTEAAADDDGKDLRLVVSAPVDYESKEFIIHLFSRLCEAVPADGSPIAAESGRHLEQLRYLRTYTTNWSASLIPKSFLTLARGSAKQRAEQPVTLPELVDSFRRYAARVGAWRQAAGGRLVIGIDELDKIRDGDRAEAFLNDIKAIFGVPGSVYLVSLSEEAMAGFARRTPSIRGSFDSAFDELVPMGPMAYRQSEQLLFKRVIGVPRPFTALCHALAGGLPRDLVRTARALIDVASPGGGKSLEDTTRALIGRELESLRRVSLRQLAEHAGPGSLLAALDAPGWPGATPRQFTDAARQVAAAVRNTESEQGRELCQELVVSLSFYATTLQVFAMGRACLIDCLKRGDYAIIDELADARYAMRVNVGLAHRLLEQYRRRNGIGPEGTHAAR